MNDDLLTPDDIRMLDRLVDGELSESERRALLLRLEHSPDGWRRCALAFLEAQAWRLEARAVVAEPAPVVKATSSENAAAAKSQASDVAARHYPETAVQPASVARKTWNGLSVWVPSLLAAGILVAVIVPQWNGRWFKEEYKGVGAGIVESTSQSTVSGPGYASVVGRSGENVQLVVAPGPGGERRVVDVPLIEPERMSAEFFGQAGTQLSPEVVKILEQNGNRVVREHRFMPITLKDGRRVVVPVEQVEIRPIGNQGFQ